MRLNYEVAREPGRENASVEPRLYGPTSRSIDAPSKRNMRVTLNLPVSLLDRLRNTVYWTPGLTLTALITTAIQESLDHLEQQHGKPFPSRLGELKSGRPRKRSSHGLTAEAYRIGRATQASPPPNDTIYVASSHR
ncbi:hypothetical protein YTPLAS18_05310 [Nitrospira sp.]|nr:hypothetical protein YTPLAS18_05310 [Nitrospira sp.]